MKIVADTGPLIGLAKIGMLDLLKSLASEVLIPPYVHKELFGKTGEETTHIESALGDFIEVGAAAMPETSEAEDLSGLDEGEKQAVLLASKTGEGVLLLIDDKSGRRAGRRMGIAVIGLVGLLLLGKEKGIVGRVVPLLHELRQNGYWLSDEIVEIAKGLSGE